MLSYDKERKTITVERKNFHCIRVVNKDVWGEMTPQAQNQPIGKRKLEFDLSPDGNNAILRTEFGEKKFYIASPPEEINRILVGFKRGRFLVGNLKSDLKDGKDGLIEYLNLEDSDKVDLNHDIPLGRLESILLSVAEKSKILPEEPSIVDELKNLMKRDDFEFGKDYTYLYENELLIRCNIGGSQYDVYGKLNKDASVFEASDVIVFHDGQEVKDFGETWVGISEDANDFYHAMLCGYLNHDEEFKDFLVCREIRDFNAREQETALIHEGREIPKYCFDVDGNKLELQIILKPESKDNYTCYYALDDYNVSITDKSGHIMTTLPEFFENSLYEDIDNNTVPLFLSEGGKAAYNDIKKELHKEQPEIDMQEFSRDTLPQSKIYSR